MDPLELALMQMGVPPEQRRAMMQYIMASQQPPMDPFIGGAGYDVKDANKWVDYGRDVNTLMADPMTAANAGMAGYGGANEIGFQAFDPIQAPPTPIAAPDRQLLDKYLARPTDDLGGWIADQIANNGATAFEVTGQLQQILNHGPFDDPELEARRTQLAQMVPSYTDEMTGQTRWDYSGIETLANKLEEQSVAQPAPGSYQDAQGNWWQQGEVKDSPMTEWYRKQGLPLPTQEYTLSDFTPEGAGYQQQADMLRQLYAAQAPVRESLDTASSAAYRNLLRMQDLARQNERQAAVASATPRQLSPNGDEYAAWLANNPIQGQGQAATDPAWQAALDRQGQTIIPPSGPPAAMSANEMDYMRSTPGATVGAGGRPNPVAGPVQPGSVSFAPEPTGPMSSFEKAVMGMGGEGAPSPGLLGQTQELMARAQRAARERENQGDPQGTKRAMEQFLGLARQRAKMGQPALDAHVAQQRANGRRFYDPKTKKFEEDRGVAQGNLNYGVARAQGRTPLQDTLRARAMAAYLMGG